MRAGPRTVLVAAVLAAAPRPAFADPTGPTPDLPWEPGADAPISAFAAVAWIMTEEAKPSLAPAGCRWCDVSLDGLDASIRRALLWRNTELANTLSDVAVFGVAPVRSLPAMDVAQAVKYAAGRQRPYARFQDATVLAAGPDPNDANLSFFS